MTNADYETFAKIMGVLACEMRYSITPEEINVRFNDLMEFDIHDIERAATHLRRTNQYMPRLCEWLKALGAAEPDPDTAARLAWTELSRLIGKHGAYETVEFVGEFAVLGQVIKQIWGTWPKVCSLTEAELKKEWFNFEPIYKHFAKQPAPAAVRLPGIVEIQNGAKGLTKEIAAAEFPEMAGLFPTSVVGTPETALCRTDYTGAPAHTRGDHKNSLLERKAFNTNKPVKPYSVGDLKAVNTLSSSSLCNVRDVSNLTRESDKIDKYDTVETVDKGDKIDNIAQVSHQNGCSITQARRKTTENNGTNPENGITLPPEPENAVAGLKQAPETIVGPGPIPAKRKPRDPKPPKPPAEPALSSLVRQYFDKKYEELAGFPPNQPSVTDVMSVNSNIKRQTKNDPEKHTYEYYCGLIDYCLSTGRCSGLPAMLTSAWQNSYDMSRVQPQSKAEKQQRANVGAVQEAIRQREEGGDV